MKTICVTGSVGTGKTTLSKKLAKSLNYKYIDIHNLVKKYKLHESYDKKRSCYVVDTKTLNKFLIGLIKKSKKDLVLDSHLSHYLPKKYVDLCIVTKTNLNVLSKRLKKRKYSKEKIIMNLQAEIFQMCLTESQFKKHNLLVVDTTKGYNLRNIVKQIKSI